MSDPYNAWIITLMHNPMSTNRKDQIVLYTDKNGKVELRADTEKDTLWASQDQIAVIFGTTKQNVGLHLKNIFSDSELKEHSVVKESFTTAKDGKQYKAKFYNLDAIIAVGYRVNSKKATKFRIWATGILRDYLVKGFSLNQRNLVSSERRFNNLHEAIDFLESKSEKPLKARVSLNLTKDLLP